MSWAVGFDDNWQRWIGYGVPAYCDHPDCTEKIDRGLGYVCGGEPYGGDHGCGLYFCSAHLAYSLTEKLNPECDEDGKPFPQRCERCMEDEDPFTAKPDHPDWIQHMETDESWAEWRAERNAKQPEAAP